MSHVAPLDSYAPRTGAAGEALDYLLNQAGLYLVARGDRVGALALAERSVALSRVIRSQDPLINAVRLNNLAGRYTDFDRLKEAESLLLEALELEESRLKSNDPALAITISNLAHVHLKRKDFEKAEALFLRAAEITRDGRGVDSAEYGISLSNLGLLYGQRWQATAQAAALIEAEKCMTQALTVTRRARGVRHPETATRHHNLGTLRARMCNWRCAATEAERALAIKLSLGLMRHPDTQNSAHTLAEYWKKSGQSDKAARLLSGDISDLRTVIAETESEHRAWVATDPKSRHFGPPSPFGDVGE
jgi:tetratricopeptide (TPR) repeat protein